MIPAPRSTPEVKHDDRGHPSRAAPPLPGAVPLLAAGFLEQADVVRTVWNTARDMLGNGGSIAPEYRVTLAALPDRALAFDSNVFSSFFIAALRLLPRITARRRFLYGCFNQLFRAWVTGADNLLDGEDKETFRLEMPGRSHAMRQVVSIMLTDRVMQRLLRAAERDGTLTGAESALLADRSLRVLLPSAAEEGMEEEGLAAWPEPDVVLNELHPLKTGILFQLSFMGPEALEYRDDAGPLPPIKRALMDFGIGCQILDDIRDMAHDYRQRKANYVLSLLLCGPDAETHRIRLDALTRGDGPNARIDRHFPEAVRPAFERAAARLRRGFGGLDDAGLSGVRNAEAQLLRLLCAKLDLGDPPAWL